MYSHLRIQSSQKSLFVRHLEIVVGRFVSEICNFVIQLHRCSRVSQQLSLGSQIDSGDRLESVFPDSGLDISRYGKCERNLRNQFII